MPSMLSLEEPHSRNSMKIVMALRGKGKPKIRHILTLTNTHTHSPSLPHLHTLSLSPTLTRSHSSLFIFQFQSSNFLIFHCQCFAARHKTNQTMSLTGDIRTSFFLLHHLISPFVQFFSPRGGGRKATGENWGLGQT